MAAIIVGGTLYPFAFYQPLDGLGPVRTLLGTLSDRPGRGDFLANILLYMPLGFFYVRAIPRSVPAPARIALAVLSGAILSLSMELSQYYDEGRRPTATDVYSNVLGTALGAAAGCVMQTNVRWPGLREAALNRVPILLLTAWLAYRLYPYVPTIDLHKYWDALKPVVLHPSLTAYDLFRHTTIWLAIGALIGGIGGHRRAWLLFPLFAGTVLGAKVLIITTMLSLAEVSGAALALLLLLFLPSRKRLRAGIAGLLLGIYVVTLRLEPFEFFPVPGPFGWVPFLSFTQGSIEVNVMSFLEKFFLYGSLIWLLSEALLPLWFSTALVGATLFLTSWAQTYLPGRSAEITDAVMALVIAAIIGVFRVEATAKPVPAAARPRTQLPSDPPNRTQTVQPRR